MLPLYKQLHAYVRRSLVKVFDPREEPLLTKDGPIPAQLLGCFPQLTFAHSIHF